MDKKFKEYSIDQPFLLPPDVREWVPEKHLARFIGDIVELLDLRTFKTTYRGRRGRPPYHPAMMLKVILYSFCTGVFSSRKMEKATYDSVATRFLAANQHPDYSSFCNFRKRHQEAIRSVFVECVALCREIGLSTLGHVAIDGTLLRGSASKGSGIKSAELERLISEDEELIQNLLQKWRDADAEEQPDELPKELRTAKTRLAKLQQAKKSLERRTQERYARECQRHQDEMDARQSAYEQKVADSSVEQEGPDLLARRHELGMTQKELSTMTGLSYQRISKLELGQTAPRESERESLESALGTPLTFRRGAPRVPMPQLKSPPERTPAKYINLTDPDSSYITHRRKTSIQGYNAQLAVDSGSQIIVGLFISNSPTDNGNLLPMGEEIQRVTGRLPRQLSADSGYYGTPAVEKLTKLGVDPYIPPQYLNYKPKNPHRTVARMRTKLSSEEGKKTYNLRAETVEPVFGRIKRGLGFREFLTRGMDNVTTEWTLVATAHNLLKMFNTWR